MSAQRLRGRPHLIVIGAGVAGLAAAETARALMPDAALLVLEGAARVGGLVETERTPDGFLIEHGADCMMCDTSNGPLHAQSAFEAGTILPAASAGATYVVRDERLVAMPPGLAIGAPLSPLALFRSDLLSFSAKLRLVMEPWRARRMAPDDESVASFVARRFGRELLDYVIGPVMEGIHGTSADRLSMQACLPKLREHEQRAGSVARGLRAQAASAQRPHVLSLRDGMGALVSALARPLVDHVRTSTPVRRITRGATRRYAVVLEAGDTLEADAVIVAAPAHRAASLVERLSLPLASLLGAVPYNRLDAVSLAYPASAWPAGLTGSGFVVPRREGRATRACTFSSMKWSGRAPEGFVLTRSVLAGAGLSDDDLRAAAIDDHAALLGLRVGPSLVRIRRREVALPVPTLGSVARRAQMEREAQALAGLALAGNALGAVGIPSCLESGRRAALRVAHELGAYAQAS